MDVNDQLLSRLETLSSLKIEESKRERILNELSDIVDFVEVLNKLNVDDVAATFTTLEGGTPLREDHPRSSQEVGRSILDHAPKSEDGFFIVPKIIE